jgi:hypothetical protein
VNPVLNALTVEKDVGFSTGLVAYGIRHGCDTVIMPNVRYKTWNATFMSPICAKNKVGDQVSGTGSLNSFQFMSRH